jgi:indolepyruvate decarboxylase
MALKTVTVAEYLVARLADLGMKHVFAVPGDYMAAFCAAVDASTTLTRIGTASEMEAGQAADAYARIAGSGACAVTYGVGAFSALNAIAGSYVERLPVVLINGSPDQVGRAWWHKDQVLFHHSTGDFRADMNAYRDVTVAAEIVADPAKAPAQIDRALTEAITWRGPVYVEVLQSVWTQQCAAPEGALKPRPFESAPSALRAAVEDTLALIAKSDKRTILWGGVEVQRLGLTKAFAKLVDKTGLGYVTDILGKSLLSEDTPGYLGTFAGVATPDPVLMREVDKAGAILMLGPVLTDDYINLIAARRDAIVSAEETRVRVGWREYRDVGLADFLPALIAAWKAPKAAPPPARQRPKAKPAKPDAAITYAGFVERLNASINDKTVVLADTSGVIYPATTLKISQANGYVSQAAWLSIGYTAAAAVGVALASGKRPVAFVGDGGFHMTATAFATLARYKIGAVIFVFDNAMYAIEQALVNPKFYTQDDPPPAPTAYCEIPSWDYVKFAQALGGEGYSAVTMGELDTAIRAAFANRTKPSLVRVALPLREMSKEVLALAQAPIPPPPTMRKLLGDKPTMQLGAKAPLALRGTHRP